MHTTLHLHPSQKEKRKEKKTDSNSTMQICSGSTRSTPLRKRASPVPLVAPALKTLVSPLRSRLPIPTLKSSTPTSVSVRLVRPSTSETNGRHHADNKHFSFGHCPFFYRHILVIGLGERALCMERCVLSISKIRRTNRYHSPEYWP